MISFVTGFLPTPSSQRDSSCRVMLCLNTVFWVFFQVLHWESIAEVVPSSYTTLGWSSVELHLQSTEQLCSYRVKLYCARRTETSLVTPNLPFWFGTIVGLWCTLPNLLHFLPPRWFTDQFWHSQTRLISEKASCMFCVSCAQNKSST